MSDDGAAASLSVVTSVCDSEDVVTKILCGEYMTNGEFNGCPVYKKLWDPSDTMYIQVLLYFWDSRDGAEFEGWWFGNELGGRLVFAHHKNSLQDSQMQPPVKGWCIPWDGPSNNELRVITYPPPPPPPPPPGYLPRKNRANRRRGGKQVRNGTAERFRVVKQRR